MNQMMTTASACICTTCVAWVSTEFTEILLLTGKKNSANHALHLWLVASLPAYSPQKSAASHGQLGKDRRARLRHES